VARPIDVSNNSQEGLGHYNIRFKIRRLKVENKWKIPGENFTHDNEFIGYEKSVIKFGLLIQFTHFEL